jgi:hypothetical protein
MLFQLRRPTDGGRNKRRRAASRGQTLAEFALVFPLFVLLLTAIIEFALIFNAVLAINFASRDASLVAAEAGDEGQADCEILDQIEHSILPPANPGLISTVKIYRVSTGGAAAETSVWNRGGSTTCLFPNGIKSITVPYGKGAQNYPPSTRCPRLAGCFGRTTIDQVGVEITYQYSSHTPIGDFFTKNGGATLIKANVMRMEPVL